MAILTVLKYPILKVSNKNQDKSKVYNSFPTEILNWRSVCGGSTLGFSTKTCNKSQYSAQVYERRRQLGSIYSPLISHPWKFFPTLNTAPPYDIQKHLSPQNWG